MSISSPAPERTRELVENLSFIRSRVAASAASANSGDTARESVTLVAVSKLHAAEDILACYSEGNQRDFGENYVQELVDKAVALPQEIQWHFIGSLQSNKAKTLAAVPNLYAVQTISSQKLAAALNKALPASRESNPLNVLLQVNTSGEDSKSGLSPLSKATSTDSELVSLSKYIVTSCPLLRLQGLMTIGSLDASLSKDENKDFQTLTSTRDALQDILLTELPQGQWGRDGKLVLSMGMSSDFESAIKAGSDIVRVGTGIFGTRPPKAG